MTIDQLEVVTPNVSGEAGAVFSGFPGQGGFAKYDAAAGKIDGKTDKIKIGKDGEMVSYVPRKGEDIMTVFPKLAKGEAFFRLDNMQNVKGFKVGIKPGSGIMLFTGTKEEFNKLQKLIK